MISSLLENWKAELLKVAAENGLSMEEVAALSDHLDNMNPDLGDVEEVVRSASEPALSARYQTKKLLGQGGMGRVDQVWDSHLERFVAQKTKLPGPGRRLFLREARIAGRLHHPGIISIHDIQDRQGIAPSYTMGMVSGQTLRRAVNLHHSQCDSSHPWTRFRLVEALYSAAQSIAYAHSQGVIHLDVKPDNIMLGDFGEVIVVDWGLALSTSQSRSAQVEGEEQAWSELSESLGCVADTWATGISGSLAFMAPEQVHQQEPPSDRCDVFSLGGCLYFLLTGVPPRRGGRELVLRILRAGEDVSFQWPDSVPEALRTLCLECMVYKASSRPTAQGFVDVLGAWLDGSQRRTQAEALTARALACVETERHQREEAAQVIQEAQRELERFKPWDPAHLKEEGWKLEARGMELTTQADGTEAKRLQLLRSALQLDPELDGARTLLADYHRGAHERAQRSGDKSASRHHELALREYGGERYGAYLRGEGTLTLVTDPPGAVVELFQHVPEGRRLVLRSLGSLGLTPLERVTLPSGSYLLRIQAEGRHTVDYPIHLFWSQHWSGCRPGESEPFPIALPSIGEIADDECYVPAGYFLMGEDRVPTWVEAFVIKKHPITNEEYITYLNSLVADGEDPLKLLDVPRERGRSPTDQGVAIYEWDPVDGTYRLTVDREGDQWEPKFPVVQVNWMSALRFCNWLGARDSKSWRLPFEQEWEKAGRGVDGRHYPWGDGFDPSFACMLDSFPPEGHRALVTVDSDQFCFDISVYGAEGMAGNVADWCMDLWSSLDLKTTPAQHIDEVFTPCSDKYDYPVSRVIRGGHWYSEPGIFLTRRGIEEGGLLPTVGIRPTRPYIPGRDLK